MSFNKKQGDLGESIANRYLQAKNYIILKKNYYTPYGEIDLIAKDSNYLVFIEVKLRRNKAYGDVLEQLSLTKQKRIIQSALYFLEQKNEPIEDCRFDFIAISYKEGSYQVNHIENAFEINI